MIALVTTAKFSHHKRRLEAIASLEPVVQNRQDCPEDSGHWEPARMRSLIQLGN